MRFAALLPMLLVSSPGFVRAGPQAQPPEFQAAAGAGCTLGATDALSTEDWRRLRDGEILIRDLKHPESGLDASLDVKGLSLIDAPPEQVWRTLFEFENWPGFMPLIRETLVTRRDSGRVWVRQRYRILFLNLEHTSIYELEPASCEVRWQLDRASHHDIAATQGRWQLLPVNQGVATLVVYRGAVDAGRAVPDFVQRMLTRRSLPRMLRQLRAQILEGTAAGSSSPD